MFTAGTPTQNTASLYNGAATPGDWYPDAGPVTLGMKFRSDAAGKVTGMRFWKGDAGNNGTHIALLYSSTGQLLAQAPFAGETSTGSQTVMFSSPADIAANTTYVAAYFTGSGYAGCLAKLFSSQGVNNGVLHAVAIGCRWTQYGLPVCEYAAVSNQYLAGFELLGGCAGLDQQMIAGRAEPFSLLWAFS